MGVIAFSSHERYKRLELYSGAGVGFCTSTMNNRQMDGVGIICQTSSSSIFPSLVVIVLY